MILLLLLVAAIAFVVGVCLGPTVHSFIKMAQGGCGIDPEDIAEDLKRGEALIPHTDFWKQRSNTPLPESLIGAEGVNGSPTPKPKRRKSKSKRKK